MTLSIIVPMLEEEQAIAATLAALRAGAPAAEIIVVDGGSRDASIAIAAPRCDRLIQAPRGRACQMNAGAALASGEVIAFVHADTIVPRCFASAIARSFTGDGIIGGRFDLAFDDPGPAYRCLAAAINLRSRLSGICTGDHAMFVRREVFARLGGFRPIELCEDLELARRLKHAGRMVALRPRVITSARRWQRHGFVRTVLRMWLIKALFLAGVSPARLRRHYSNAR